MTKNNVNILSKAMVLALGMSLLCTCAKSESLYSFDSQEQGVKIHISLNNVKKQKTDEEASIFIYGEINLDGIDKEIDYFNLECLGLSIRDKVSTGLYVDSTVDFLQKRYSADDNGSISVNVYWVFPESSNIEVDEVKDSKMKLVVDSSKICVNFK